MQNKHLCLYTIISFSRPCALGSCSVSVTVCKRPLHSKRLHVLAAVPVRQHCIPLYQVKIPILKSLVPLSASFHVSCHPYAVNCTIITVSYSMPPTHFFFYPTLLLINHTLTPFARLHQPPHHILSITPHIYTNIK